MRGSEKKVVQAGMPATKCWSLPARALTWMFGSPQPCRECAATQETYGLRQCGCVFG